MSKDVEKRARRIVKICKLDAEDFTEMPNDFEECVEFVKEKILLSKSRDRELDDLIFERGIQQLEKEYGVKFEIEEIDDDSDDNPMYW